MMEKEEVKCPAIDDIDALEDSIREVRDVLINALTADEVNLRASIGTAIFLLNDILG